MILAVFGIFIDIKRIYYKLNNTSQVQHRPVSAVKLSWLVLLWFCFVVSCPAEDPWCCSCLLSHLQLIWSSAQTLCSSLCSLPDYFVSLMWDVVSQRALLPVILLSRVSADFVSSLVWSTPAALLPACTPLWLLCVTLTKTSADAAVSLSTTTPADPPAEPPAASPA